MRIDPGGRDAKPVAIVVGASSGIGRALAKELAARGWRLGLAARREDLLRDLSSELPGGAEVQRVDVTALDEARAALEALIARLGRVDLFVQSSGWGEPNPDLALATEVQTVDVNVRGWVNAVNVAVRTFERQGSGHLVGISSIAGIRGAGVAPAYGASKAFESTYLDALRASFARRLPRVTVTDVVPGWVDTAMAKSPQRFWVAPVDKAARQIADAIGRRERRAYVTKRWRLVAWVLRAMPDGMWLWLQGRPPRS